MSLSRLIAEIWRRAREGSFAGTFIGGITLGMLLHRILSQPQKLKIQGMATTQSGSDARKPTTRRQSMHPIPDVQPDTVHNLIEARRSILPKDYTGAAVKDDIVTQLLDVARWAPTHGRTEPWRFVVHAGDGRRRLLDATLAFYAARPAEFWTSAEAWKGEFPTFADFEAYFRKQCTDKWLRCSHLVSICMKRQQPEPGKRLFPDHEEVAAVACAVQNMHLMATALRVGAYWSSWFEHFTGSDDGIGYHELHASQGDRWLGVFCIGECQKMDTFRSNRRPLEQFSTWKTS